MFTFSVLVFSNALIFSGVMSIGSTDCQLRFDTLGFGFHFSNVDSVIIEVNAIAVVCPNNVQWLIAHRMAAQHYGIIPAGRNVLRGEIEACRFVNIDVDDFLKTVADIVVRLTHVESSRLELKTEEI